MRLQDQDIGGGVTRRAIRMGERYVPANTRLTRAEVLAIRAPNRNSMIDRGVLHIFPVGLVVSETPAERHMVNRGFGRWDVIEGVRLNEAPLPKVAAEALVREGKTTEH